MQYINISSDPKMLLKSTVPSWTAENKQINIKTKVIIFQ